MENKEKPKYPSTFTVDNFSSTTKLAENEYKIPVGSVETINEKAYNPYEHREIAHPNTFTGALTHLLKSSLGTGILSVPFAVQSIGLIAGCIGTILTGSLCTYTVYLLVSASQEICRRTKKPMLGFAATAEAIFSDGPKAVKPWAGFAKLFVEIALLLTYFVGCAVYIVFITESLQQLVGYHYPETKEWAKQWYMIAIMIPLILFCQVRQLKYMVPFSFIANTTMVIAFAITLYYMFSGLAHIDFDQVQMVKDMTKFPLFFSTVIFAMEGIGTILPIENSMMKQQFIGTFGVLNVAMGTVIVLYTVIGFFGYLRFGDGVNVNVIYNLPEQETIAQVAKACISIAVFFTFMLQFSVPIQITWEKISKTVTEKYYNLTQIVMRTVVVMCITAIAAAVPDLSLIIDLVGAIFFSILGLFIPATIDLVLYWDDLGRFRWKLWKNVCIIILAAFALVSGSIYAIRNLIEDFTKKDV